MQAEALHQVGLSLFNYQHDARSNKHKELYRVKFIVTPVSDATGILGNTKRIVKY